MWSERMAEGRNTGIGSPGQQLAPLDHLPDRHAPARRGADHVPETQARVLVLRWPHQPEAPRGLRGLGIVWRIILLGLGGAPGPSLVWGQELVGSKPPNCHQPRADPSSQHTLGKAPVQWASQQGRGCRW